MSVRALRRADARELRRRERRLAKARTFRQRAHARLALAYARNAAERQQRWVPHQQPTAPRRTCTGSGRPRARRRVTARSSGGGGSSGDDGAGSSEPPGLAGRHPRGTA